MTYPKWLPNICLSVYSSIKAQYTMYSGFTLRRNGLFITLMSMDSTNISRKYVLQLC